MLASNGSHAKYIHIQFVDHFIGIFFFSYFFFLLSSCHIVATQGQTVKMLNFIIDSILFFICKYVCMWIHYQKCFESIGFEKIVGSIK